MALNPSRPTESSVQVSDAIAWQSYELAYANGGKDNAIHTASRRGCGGYHRGSTPRPLMLEETRAFFAMSAGRDEAALIHDHEKLSPSAPLASFVKAKDQRLDGLGPGLSERLNC